MMLKHSHLLQNAAGLVCATALFAGLSISPALAGTQGPQGRRCRNVGPISDEATWCGCTWGVVYVNGQPVDGARITFRFGSTFTTTQTLDDSTVGAEGETYYSTHADVLGANYGDLATVSAVYGGNTMTRTVRLIPNSEGEQQLNFVFPSRGHWQTYAGSQVSPGIAINAVASSATTLWVGSTNGLVSWNLSTGLSMTHQLGLPSTDVRAIAVVSDNQVWIGTTNGLSRFNGSTWATQSTGLLSGDIRALAVAPDGTLVVGAYDALNGGISAFDGSVWQPLPDVNGALPNLVTALVFDEASHLWVGTDGYGVTRWKRGSGSNGQTFSTANGLSSDVISSIAAENGAVWLGTRAYLNVNGEFGGVTRFDMNTQTWTVYTRTHGLSADDVLGVVIDPAGVKWFNTVGGGISTFDGLNWWRDNTTNGLVANTIRALVIHPDGTVWAGSSGGINRFVRMAAGTAPQVSQVTVLPPISLFGEPIILRAVAEDTDNNGLNILAYEWASDRDGMLGSEAVFTVRSRRLSPGTHIISVRAMDDEGMWSAVATTTLTIHSLTFIPLIQS